VSGGALEPLFGACATDDVLTLAEAESCTFRSMLLPESLEADIECLDLVDHCGVTPLGQRVPEGYPALAQRVDLFVEFRVDDHANFNERRTYPIPTTDNRSAAREEKHRDHGGPDDERRPREEIERGRHS
jgi:hypothetical protein